jgi:hypothetical protein
MPRRRTPIQERIWRFVTRGEPGECWPWLGAKNDGGYGMIGAGGKHGGMLRAHRVMWEMERGPIPAGLECDHLCRNRACVNPRHLALVTHRTNTLRGAAPTALNARKTHCPAGHPYDEANTYHAPVTGWRQCRICRRGYVYAWRARRS